MMCPEKASHQMSWKSMLYLLLLLQILGGVAVKLSTTKLNLRRMVRSEHL